MYSNTLVLRNSPKISVFLIAALMFAMVILPTPRANPSTAAVAKDHSTSSPTEAFGRLPLSFELNQGQTDSRVKFLARGQGYNLFLTSDGAVFTFKGRPEPIQMRLHGAASESRVSGDEELPGKINYFVGNQPDNWRTNIPTFARVRYEQVYPGVDLIYYGNRRQLEYDFVVQPGASTKQIRLAFDGAGKLKLNRDGDLVLQSGTRSITLLKPKAYQEIGAERREVKVKYALKRGGQVTFQLGDYDRNHALVIDPVLVYSTYLGSNDLDQGNTIAVDSSGNAYIAGQTASANFPTVGPIQGTKSTANDAFVAKLNSAGTALLYSTFIGGTGNDFVTGIAIDGSGNAYVTGQTTSTNFPVPNALHANLRGSSDAFVSQLNATGSALVYSTYLGGRAVEGGNAIAVDGGGNAYVTGFSTSRDFPTTNPVQPNRSGNAVFKSTNSAGNWSASDTGLIGSSVNDLVFHPTNSATIFAATDGGVFKTTDGGANWTALNGQTALPVNKVALDPTNPSIIYAATFGGMFKSTDGGNSFTAINNGIGTFFMRSVAVDPVTPTTLYATSFGPSFFKSTNGGAEWDSIFVNNIGTINGLLVDPNTPTTIYLATDRGVFKSTNSGVNFSPSGTGMQSFTRINSLTIDKTHNILYAATTVGVFKSTNNAGNWTAINGNIPSFVVASLVAIDPANTSNLYAVFPSTGILIHKTTDSGVTWNPSATGYPGTTVNSLIVDPAQTSTLYAGTQSGGDAFVTKLSANGTSKVYSTFLGGIIGDEGKGIAVDGSGNAYVTGSTQSHNFPTASAFQAARAGGTDAFLTKLNSTGSSLVYSTFLGGESNDIANAIKVDGSGNAYITGSTSSQSFPTSNAFQSTIAQQFTSDAFVTKMNAAGSALVYSTYLGGGSADEAFSIAIDGSGSAYVTGTTNSNDFPVPGAIQTTLSGFGDAFVTKLTPAGSGLVYSTYLGGSDDDDGIGIAVDSSQNVYVIGGTSSNDFPRVNALQPNFGGFIDVFIAKLRPAPDLSVTMTDSPDPVNFGSNLTYTITVRNNGDLTATGVNLSDTLPAGSTFVSATPTQGTCTGTSTVNCAIGTLNPGAQAVVTLVIKPPAVRTATNTATATLVQTDTNPANNTATVETLVDFADISIAKRAAQNLVNAGGRITYSLFVKNKGVLPADVTVTDNLPAGTSLITCAATGNGVCGGTGNNVSVTFSQLAVDASEAIVITVAVSGSATNGTVINNTATVTSPLPDPVTSDNSSTASVTVAAVTVLPKSNGLIAFAADRAFTPVSEPSGIYTVKPDGTGETLFPNIPLNAGRPSWSPDGTKLAFQFRNFAGPSSPTNEISVINANGTGLLKLVENVSDFSRSITWSPNGTQIAYIGAGLGTLETVRTVHIANTDGSGWYRLPGSPSFLSSVDWSPDGSKLLFADDREIWVMNADGTNQTKLTTTQQTPDGQTTDSDPHWSPDGTKILFNRSTTNNSHIFWMNANGTNIVQLFNFQGRDPDWSADGQLVVLQQGNEICTVNLNGTNFKCVTNNGFFDFQPNWQALPNASPTPTPTPAPTFSISGRITSSDGQQIAPQVSLTGPVNAMVGIDGTGNYQFINLPAGQYTVTPVSIFHSFNPANRNVTISNANITGQDFVATFVPANITGHVKDNNGNPLAGIKITSTGGFPTGTTFTDATGFYSFPNVQRNRTYSIFPDPFTVYNFDPQVKTIANLTQSEVVDFVGTKQPSNVIAGRVIEAITGQGIANIQVSLGQDNAFVGSTFTDSSGNFTFGERKSNHSYSISISFHQTFIFQPIVNAPTPFAQIVIPSLTTNQNLIFRGERRNTVQLTAPTAVTENSGSKQITVTRTGDLASAATVNFVTSDTAGLTACTVVNGKASERCDYETVAGTLRFAANESSKSLVVPIVDDVHVEGNETFAITLSAPIGAQIGSIATATLTITDNDTTPATQNPIDGVQPFITQQYFDFLGRLPDSIGLANWMATLGGCPNGGFGENLNPTCDRVHVSSGFFLSDEFRGRGYWAYRFYEVGFNRRPLYAEFVPDMAKVGGPQSPASELLSKAAYTEEFVLRTEFINRFNALSNSAYVNALEQNAEITLTNKAALIAALDSNQKTRAAVLREIVELKAVEDLFFIRAFVAMQYFGYLRRDPDTVGFNNWVTTLTADPSNIRHMIFGFLFSNEYRSRFGP